MSYRASAVSISHYVKARLRRSLKARQGRYDLLRNGLKQARHVVICVIRDEGHRLAFFLQYYRDLGFEHFICIDNGSTDGTAELLSCFDDVSLLSAHATAYVWRSAYDDVLQSALARKRAYDKASRALALDPELPSPYAVLAVMLRKAKRNSPADAGTGTGYQHAPAFQ